jgi:5,10-methylene-tetrahydrofolate dehydrogenase/methenyl tetrahydrofolate cyclohydrolase
VLSRIDVTKDVDGFHVNNMGALALEGYEPMFMPCTPRGVMELLDYYKISVEGKHVVILGKSNIVGLPLAFMMMKRNATVTVCNHMTQNEEQITRQADVLVSAVGIPGLVKLDWVKEGVIVVDVGINSIVTKEQKNKIVGDVDAGVFEKALLMTPVPGGVGPMTVAMLMKATVESSLRRLNE